VQQTQPTRMAPHSQHQVPASGRLPKSTALNPGESSPLAGLLKATYGKGEPSAQLMALFFSQYFAMAALARRLRESHKKHQGVGDLYAAHVTALSIYLKTMLEVTRKAVQTGNAQFFKDFALALEEQYRNSAGRDPVRTWLIMHKLKREPPKTAREIALRLKEEARTQVSERQVYRLCKKLKVEIAKGKEGRPPKL
jgi:hypothetical protein